MGKQMINIYTCDVCQRKIPDDEFFIYGTTVTNDSYEFPVIYNIFDNNDSTTDKKIIRKKSLK